MTVHLYFRPDHLLACAFLSSGASFVASSSAFRAVFVRPQLLGSFGLVLPSLSSVSQNFHRKLYRLYMELFLFSFVAVAADGDGDVDADDTDAGAYMFSVC